MHNIKMVLCDAFAVFVSCNRRHKGLFYYSRSIETPTWHRDDNSDGWGFEWKEPIGFSCVRPDFDIVVPMYAPYTRKALVSPFNQKRNITVLLRFKVDKTDGKYLIANHGAP